MFFTHLFIFFALAILMDTLFVPFIITILSFVALDTVGNLIDLLGEKYDRYHTQNSNRENGQG